MSDLEKLVGKKLCKLAANMTDLHTIYAQVDCVGIILDGWTYWECSVLLEKQHKSDKFAQVNTGESTEIFFIYKTKQKG